MTDRIRQIQALGQALWLDFLSREFLQSGKLEKLVDHGLAGVTSNPTILQKAIAAGDAYDQQIRELAEKRQSTQQIYDALLVSDIGRAADVLRPVYNETHGRDGFVSVEVNPALAHQTEATISEARRLFHLIDRPNIMVKVPGTEAGLPAIRTLIGEGINVNVTLIFSVAMYERVAQAYIDGLVDYHRFNRPLGLVASVASFFVSRVDSLVDRLLQERVDKGDEPLERLLGLAAVANAKVAYSRFKAIFQTSPFHELRAEGARPQRTLWASTSTKNPDYPDTKYIDPLIGPDTVNTVPLQTLEAIRDHSVVAQTIEQNMEQAHGALEQLRAAGIDMDQVTAQLLDEGIQLFADSYEQLLSDLDKKRQALLAPG